MCPNKDILSAYFDDEIEGAQRKSIEEHVSVCTLCQETLAGFSSLRASLRDDPEPDIHGACRAGIQPVWTTYVRDQKLPIVPGIIVSDPDQPDFEVPKISSWDELFSLLSGRFKKII